MRRGEILGLRWNQIDFARGLILVQRTKTGRDRVIPTNSTIRETLTAIGQQAQGDQVFPINDVKRSFAYACVKLRSRTSVSMIFATLQQLGSLIEEPMLFRTFIPRPTVC